MAGFRLRKIFFWKQSRGLVGSGEMGAGVMLGLGRAGAVGGGASAPPACSPRRDGATGHVSPVPDVNLGCDVCVLLLG